MMNMKLLAVVTPPSIYHLLMISSWKLPFISMTPLESNTYSIILVVINPWLWFDYPIAKETNKDILPVCVWFKYSAVESVYIEYLEDILCICTYCLLVLIIGCLHTFFWDWYFWTKIIDHVLMFWLCNKFHEVILMAWYLLLWLLEPVNTERHGWYGMRWSKT